MVNLAYVAFLHIKHPGYVRGVFIRQIQLQNVYSRKQTEATRVNVTKRGGIDLPEFGQYQLIFVAKRYVCNGIILMNTPLV